MLATLCSGAQDQILTNFMTHKCQFKLLVLHNNNPNYIVIWLWLTFTLLMNNFYRVNQKISTSKANYFPDNKEQVVMTLRFYLQ